MASENVQICKLLLDELRCICRAVDGIASQLPSGQAVTQRNVSENPDSITLGSPTNGQIKVYGDFSKPDELAVKVQEALKLLASAKKQLGSVGDA